MDIVFDKEPFSFYLKKDDNLEIESVLKGRCDGKVGLYSEKEPHDEFLPCVYDEIYEDLGNPDVGEYLGFKTRIGHLYGYYYGNIRILKEEYQDINPSPRSFIFQVQKDGFWGELRYDLASDVLSELIPVSYLKVVYGERCLVACYRDGKWDLFRKLQYDNKTLQYTNDSDYKKIGTYDTIVEGFSEPYPYKDCRICFFDNVQCGIDRVIPADSLFEVSMTTWPGLTSRWTIIKKDNSFGLWCNDHQHFLLPVQFDSIVPIEARDEWGDKYPLFQISRDDRIGVYSVKEKRFLINVIFDWVSPVRRNNDTHGDVFGFIVRINQKIGVFGMNGEFLIEPQYDSAELLRMNLRYLGFEYRQSESLLLRVRIDTRYGIYSDRGTLLVEEKYDHIDLIKTRIHNRVLGYEPEETILFKVKKDGCIGVIDDNGEVFIDCVYNQIAYVHEMDLFVLRRGSEIKNVPFSQIDRERHHFD